jgi:hypothetical protein
MMRLALGLAAPLVAVPRAQAQTQRILVQPFLQQMTPTSGWIVWETDFDPLKARLFVCHALRNQKCCRTVQRTTEHNTAHRAIHIGLIEDKIENLVCSILTHDHR